jgi:AAHS family 4-hydroxybenzoate transporter-like MFS transporter
MIADGYDLQAAAFAAPDIIRAWGVPRAAMGPVFSAGLTGLLVGAPLFGYLGDRFGRKTAVIAGLIIAGSLTLVSAGAGSLRELAVLRFLVGIGIGAVLPNTIALTAELAPWRIRASLIVLMFTGITLGGAVPGFVSAALVPAHGWPVLFLVGGTVPLIVAGLLVFAMPESASFLLIRGASKERLLRLLRRVAPEVEFPPGAIFALRTETEERNTLVSALFSGRFAVVTPILWLLFAATLLTNYFLGSWMPVLFESTGVPPGQAAIINSLYQLGGLIGGIAISLLLDRFQFRLIALLFLFAGPVVALVGWPGLTVPGIAAAAGVAGFFVIGLQFALNASAGLLYPAHCRSTGVGWAFGVGRIGSIIGPLLGGALIAAGTSVPTLFLVPVLPLALGAVLTLVLLYAQRSTS